MEQFVDPEISMTRTYKYSVRSFYVWTTSSLNLVSNIALDSKTGKYWYNL